ncbi:hypothetical protein [Solidesulfovibrio sp. C21]|uniref:hypothetical protein n=1 Tax=Solidesulfovibrio sp. C21 TaxID=3398613 RepID=UPI0039FD5BD8
MRKNTKPDLWRAGLCGEDKKNCGGFLLSSLRRSVNRFHIAGLLFGRDLILAGLACLGWPWSHQLSLWVDWLDYRAEELRERQGARL